MHWVSSKNVKTSNDRFPVIDRPVTYTAAAPLSYEASLFKAELPD